LPRGGSVQCGTRSLADGLVPTPSVFLDVDAYILVPEREFSHVHSRSVATRDERRLCILNRLERFGDVLHAMDASRIALRPDEDEVIVHYGKSLHPFAVREKFEFCQFGINENYVGIPSSSSV
jgi:hypothetical protein